MKLSISEVIRSFQKFTKTQGFQFKEFIEVLIKSKATYTELFKTGEIKCAAEGEKVIIDFKANVCGDILIFIRANENSAFADQDVTKLILTDIKIQEQKEIALKILKQKHEGLIAVPNLISLLINFLLILLSVVFTFRSIDAMLHGYNIRENIRELWPWIFPVITFLLRKNLGPWLISFSFRFF